jgi:prefoldin subunit 4
MASSGGQMLKPEEETEVEVRREDQDNINLFGRLNARLHEVRDEKKQLKV